ncbi:SprB repeat-containing protein, partial [Paenimyroides ummariense]
NRTATANVTIDEPDALVSNMASTSITCNGANNGSVVLAPTGGVAPYTYLWDTGATTSSITNLPAGTYSVTITDANGCTLTETATITDPAVLAIASSSHTDVTWYGGNDGSATVSVTGGTAPYTYSWSPSGGTNATATGLIAGNYTVTVTDANGCTVTESFTVIQPIPLMVQSVSQTNVKCNGASDGTATIVAMGGNAPYTYLWSPSGGTNATATGLAAGTYSVLVTDSTGNTITENFTITQPGAIQAMLSNSRDVLCNGGNNGTATITVTGGTAPFTYKWSNGISTTNATVSNLVVGNYTVQVTDANGCTASTPVSVIISQPAALVFTTSNSTNISCYGLNDGSVSVVASGGVAPYSYLWSNGQSGSSLTNLGKGTYVVTVTDANNCMQTQSFTITEPAFVTAPTASSQNFCVGQNATLASIVINGSNIKWYSAATGGTLLPATTALVSGTTYYASQTVGTCESTTRTPVQVTINQAQALTTTQLNVCSNSRVQTMVVDGFNYTQLKWYSSSTSTIQLPSSTLLATGTYYVSSVVGTCESARQAIQVTVAATVPAPTASFQTVCGGSTLNDLVVVKDPSATLNWYSSMQSMIPLAGTTQVATGTYYVQQVIGNCESSRIAVQVQVTSITIPTIASITTCEGTTIADLNTNGSTNYVWYTDNTTTAALPGTYLITSGSYYIANQNGSCISARKNIAVNVGTRPASPTGQATQLFNFSAKVSDLAMNEPNVKWFLSAADAAKLMNELSPNTP